MPNDPVNENTLGKLIIARTAQGAIMAVGQQVSWTDGPTVSIRKPNGERIFWRADLCEVIADEDAANWLVPLCGPPWQ